MNESKAISSHWWVRWRNQQPVQGALERAYLQIWSKNIEKTLAANLASKKTPSTWQEFTTLLATDSPRGKNRSEKSSPLEGLSSPIGQLLIAQVLHRDLHQLAPSVSQWLAASVSLLVDRPQDDSSIAVYVDFRLSCEASCRLTGEVLHPLTLRHPSFSTTDELAAAIRAVSSELDQVLGALSSGKSQGPE